MNKILLVTIAAAFTDPSYVFASGDHQDKAQRGCFSCFRIKQKVVKHVKEEKIDLEQETVSAHQSKQGSLVSESPEKSKKKKVKTVMIEEAQIKEEKSNNASSEAKDDAVENQEVAEKNDKISKREKIKRENLPRIESSPALIDKAIQGKSEVKNNTNVEESTPKNKSGEAYTTLVTKKKHARQKSTASGQSSEADHKKEGNK